MSWEYLTKLLIWEDGQTDRANPGGVCPPGMLFYTTPNWWYLKQLDRLLRHFANLVTCCGAFRKDSEY